MNKADYNNNRAFLQVLPSLKSGGVERGTIDIAKQAKSYNFEPYVASNGGTMVKELDNIAHHINIPLNSKNPLKILLNARKLADIISMHNIDVIHARSRAPAWSSYLASRYTKRIFVTTFHGIYKYNNYFKKKYNEVMTYGDKIIATSIFTKEHILNNYNVAEDKIAVIHRGVDTSSFDYNNISENRIKELSSQLNVYTNKKIILLPGRITRWKGHSVLIDAANLLPRNKFTFLIVGDSKDHDQYLLELQTKIKNYNLEEDVFIYPNVKDIQALYNISDIVISASTEPESFGRIAAEAQLMGKIVIATNIGGAKETVIDNQTGFLIMPNNPKDMASKIIEAISLPENMIFQIKENAGKHIKENFSLDLMCKKTFNLYQKLLESKYAK